MKQTTLAVACALGTFAAYARADIVHFANPAPGQPGHYDWRSAPHDSANMWLDITRPAHQQPDVQSGNSIGQVRDNDPVGFDYVWHAPTGPGPIASIHGTSSFIFVVAALPYGAPIPSVGVHWNTTALLMEIDEGEPEDTYSPFPEGELLYMGVRTATDNHGWIGVQRHGGTFDALSWAYETDSGVPIIAGQIPAPGAVVLFALTSFTTIRRRRP